MGGGSVMNQHEGQDRWSKDLTFRVGDEVGGHWKQLSNQLYGAGKVFCSDRTDEALLAES